MARQVFFATNRQWDGEKGRFGPGATEAEARLLWLGSAAVDPAAGRVEPLCDGQDDFAAPEGSCGQSLDRFLQAARGGLPLISIHGFQYTFDDALLRTAELAEWLEAGDAAGGGLEVVPFLFTWPSSGLLTRAAYEQDRTSAKHSGFAIARLFRELAARGAAALRRPVLLVHSSGAWALQHGVQAATPWQGPPLFRDAILAAADVAADALSDPLALAPLADMAERVTALVFPADPVLKVLSRGVNRNGPRLGSDGPPPGTALPGHVRALDVTWLVDLRPLVDDPVPADSIGWNTQGHQYYRNQAAVRDAMARLVRAEALPPPDWRQYAPPFTFEPAPRCAPFYWYATGAAAALAAAGPAPRPDAGAGGGDSAA